MTISYYRSVYHCTAALLSTLSIFTSVWNMINKLLIMCILTQVHTHTKPCACSSGFGQAISSLYKILYIHSYVNTSFVLQCMSVCLSFMLFWVCMWTFCPWLSIWPVEPLCVLLLCILHMCKLLPWVLWCHIYSTIESTWEVFAIFYLNNNILLK